MRLAVGLISGRDWRPAFGLSLIALLDHATNKDSPFEEVHLCPRVNCSLPPSGRRIVVSDAYKRKCTHLLFIDDDMIFPRETANLLAAHGKPFVAANYQNRSLPRPTVLGLDRHLLLSKDKDGLEEVGRVGFGVVWLDLAVLADVPKPWFAAPYDPETERETGEDYFFCDQWRAAGHKIYVDHGLSNAVFHICEARLAVV